MNGTTLINHGWPEGPLMGVALKTAHALAADGLGEAAVLAALDQVKAAPHQVEADSVLYELAQAVLAAIPPEPKPNEIRPVPMEAPIWGVRAWLVMINEDISPGKRGNKLS